MHMHYAKIISIAPYKERIPDNGRNRLNHGR
jgi:hypothetical protein